MGPKFRRVPRGGPRAWPLWDTRPCGAVWGGMPGPPGPSPASPWSQPVPGSRLLPKWPLGFASRPRPVCKSCIGYVSRPCRPRRRQRTERSACQRRERRASIVQGACAEPRAAAVQAACAVLASPGASCVRQPREPRASDVRRAVRAHAAPVRRTAPASVQACGGAQPLGGSSLPFPPSKADSLRVALSTERLPCDYPSDNVLIVLLALCQANLNCISILQHLFSAITIWINLKL